MLSKKDIITANKLLDRGKVMNEGSLDFAVKTQERSKNWLRSAAILTRAILIDHVFEDGNKRTAATVIMALMELNHVLYDPEKIPTIITTILKKNETNIQTIERHIKHAIRP